MTAELLREAGESLYGSLWQSALARDLGVNDRTVRRWDAGDNAVPAGVWAELGNLVRERMTRLTALRERLP